MSISFLAPACTWPTPWIASSLVLLFEEKKALHEAESILYYKNYGKWMKDPNEENKKNKKITEPLHERFHPANCSFWFCLL